jgi:hypothetical protein
MNNPSIYEITKEMFEATHCPCGNELVTEHDRQMQWCNECMTDPIRGSKSIRIFLHGDEQ